MLDAYQFSGDDPLSLQEAVRLMGDLNQMSETERDIDRALRSNDASHLDHEELGRLMGEEAGLIRRKRKEWELTPKALRKIGERALEDIFGKLRPGMFGSHDLDRRGFGIEKLDETQAYQFGDAFSIDVRKSVMNAVLPQGSGTPVKVGMADFDVQETASRTECSTVILLDMSRSMMRNGCFEAGRKVALALDTLIHNKFPKDNLYVAGFCHSAYEMKPQILLDDFCEGYDGRDTNIPGG